MGKKWKRILAERRKQARSAAAAGTDKPANTSRETSVDKGVASEAQVEAPVDVANQQEKVKPKKTTTVKEVAKKTTKTKR